ATDQQMKKRPRIAPGAFSFSGLSGPHLQPQPPWPAESQPHDSPQFDPRESQALSRSKSEGLQESPHSLPVGQHAADEPRCSPQPHDDPQPQAGAFGQASRHGAAAHGTARGFFTYTISSLQTGTRLVTQVGTISVL